MEQVTIGPKYQIVIPKQIRKKVAGITPGNKVIFKVSKDNQITVHPQPLSKKEIIDKYYGCMKDAWKDLDPIKEHQKIEQEWEERLKEQEKIWRGSR